MSPLNRESIRNGWVQKMAEEGERQGHIRRLTEEERTASRTRILETAPDPENLWVFAYGSLMWNPAFHYAERRMAKIYGYHRSFCLHTVIGRGTPEQPGLMLGIDRGGSCQGIAYRLHPEQAEEEMDIIWAREMVTGSYSPRWMNMHGEDGVFPGVAFVIDRTHDRYACGLTLEQVVHRLATASGPLGPCREYLENLVIELDKLGVADGPMHALQDMVAAKRHPDPET